MEKVVIKIWASIGIAILVLAFLQPAKAHEGKYYFQHMDMEKGLSHNAVFSILQDKKGFMWFGTKDGLNRYDGHTFKVYKNDPADPNSIGSNTVYSLFEDQQGLLWIGTIGGVFIYNPELDNFIPFDARTAHNEPIAGAILDIKEDKKGNLWFAAGSKGVFVYSSAENTLSLFQHQEEEEGSIGPGSVSSIAVDRRGIIWIGIIGGGIYKYLPSSQQFEEYMDDQEALKNDFVFELQDYNSHLYIGTKNGGLKKLDKATGHFHDIISYDTDNHPLFIRNIVKYSDEELWTGTEFGLYVYNTRTNTHLHLTQNANDPYSLSDNAIHSLYKDREGGMWVGTYFGGINYLPNQPTPFEKYYPVSNTNAVSGKRIREFCQDKNGNLWIGTEDAGLNFFDPITRRFEHFLGEKGENNLSYHNIHGLMTTGDELWVGTYSQGLDVMNLETGKIRHYEKSTEPNALRDNDIYALCKDTNGNAWIGTVSGAYRYNRKTDDFTFISAIGTIFVYDILEDHEGNIWFASYSDGLICYNPSNAQAKQYRHVNGDTSSLSHNTVINLFEDSKKRLWVATEGGGICLFNKQEENFLQFSTQDGLPSNIIYKILEDDNENLWLSSSNGLAQFNPETLKTRVYTKANGLLMDQFNYKSGIKTKDGTLYFGCGNGFIAFNPLDFEENHFQPQMVLTGIQLFNEDVPVGKGDSPLDKAITYTKAIQLNHTQSSLSFSFAALGFTAPESRQYAYYMEGFDNGWNYLKENQKITYSNLPPGEYAFKVKAAGDDNNWDTQEATLDIDILPPFWKTRWAYSLYFMFTGFIIFYSLRSYRKRIMQRHRQKLKLLEDEKEKEIYQAKIEFFTNITHEIRTPLTLIKAPLEEILKDKEDYDATLRENLQVMKRNTKRLINLSNQLLDFRKTEKKGFSLSFVKTDVCALLQEIQYRFKPSAQQKGLALSLHLPQDHFYADIDPEAVTKILSNLFSNAVKNAKEKIEVRLSVSVPNENNFTISVSNDGNMISENLKEKIFEPFFQIKDDSADPGQGTGLGLPLARSLTELHNGQLYLKSVDKTNVFSMTLPIKQKNTIALLPDVETLETAEYEETISSEDKTAKRSKPAILIVEDNKELSKFLLDHMKPYYFVFKAYDGKQALDLLAQEPIDLIISDVMMPVMNGFELCHHVKSQIDHSHIPIILLTAKNSLKSKIEGLEMGADVYIEKPFSMEYLLLQVKNLLHYRDQVRHSFANSPLVHANVIAHTQADEQFLGKANDIIYENIADEQFGVNELADALHMSQSSLLRKIKGISELTPNGYIRLVRLKRAAELLQEGEYNVTEISEMVGFNSSSYFSKCFQKQFGELPKDYVKKLTI